MARKALNGTLCRICGERPRYQYKSELSPYCRECKLEKERAHRQAKAKAKAPTPPRRSDNLQQPKQPKPQRPAKAKAKAPKSERTISPERQAEIEATYRLMVAALERKAELYLIDRK